MRKKNIDSDIVAEIPDSDLPKSHTLKSIPADVYRIVQREQADIKISRGTNSFSFECTIYKMIRDYERCRRENKAFKPQLV